jgi:hypothetical protein
MSKQTKPPSKLPSKSLPSRERERVPDRSLNNERERERIIYALGDREREREREEIESDDNSDEEEEINKKEYYMKIVQQWKEKPKRTLKLGGLVYLSIYLSMYLSIYGLSLY